MSGFDKNIDLQNIIDKYKIEQIQKDNFVASICHDLKNPTMAQIKCLELLLNSTFGDINQEQKKILQMILDSCHYMKSLLNSILETYKKNSGHVKLYYSEFSLQKLVSECVAEITYPAESKGICIQSYTDTNIEHTYADNIQIKRVVSNLLSNAVKYAFNNTLIYVRLYQKEKNIYFEFENKSPYITQEHQNIIFNRYVAFDNICEQTGTGIGLYVSKQIISAHGGTLYVKSFENNTNIFGFVLPVSQNSKQYQKEIRF